MKKMMKKMMKTCTAAALVLMMGVRAFAAPSIVGSLDIPHVSSNEGTAVLTPITDGMYDEKLQEQVNKLNNAKPNMSVKDAFGDLIKEIGDVPMYDGAGKKLK